jgi:hypothetical protein
MKIKDSTFKVAKSHEVEESAFKIESTSKAFDILSSKIYSHPRRAIVRELIANAWDAHIQAGKKMVPLKIHSPSNREPYFSVRDFGEGLSNSEIFDIYAIYFKSSKTDSNSQIGCLGLGSKSPFAYTDMFTVTSCNNGIKNIYSMFKGEDGLPKVSLVLSNPSKEASGLEVSFACEKKDINVFHEYLEDILHRFPSPEPQITGSLPLQKTTDNVILRGYNWKIVKNIYNSICKMGCIAYPIDVGTIAQGIPREFYWYKMVLTVPIGSVDIAANREELQYTSRTKAYLISKMNRINVEILDIIRCKVSTARTRWEAECIADKIIKKLRFIFREPKETLSSIYWNSLPIRTAVPVLNFNKTIYQKVEQATRTVISKRSGDRTIYPRFDTTFMVNDIKTHPDARIKNWLRNNPSYNKVILFDKDIEDKNKFEEICSTIGINSKYFRLVSDLKNPRVTKKKSKNNILMAEVVEYSSKGRNQVLIDLSKVSGLYVIKAKDHYSNYRSLKSGYSVGPSEIMTMAKFISQITGKKIPVYELGKRDINKITKHNIDLQEISEYSSNLVKQELEDGIKREHILNYQDSLQERKWIQCFANECVEEYYKKLKPLIHEDSPYRKYVNIVQRWSRETDYIIVIRELSKISAVEIPSGKIRRFMNMISNRYPLLRVVKFKTWSSLSTKNYASIAEYINLIDQSRKDK